MVSGRGSEETLKCGTPDSDQILYCFCLPMRSMLTTTANVTSEHPIEGYFMLRTIVLKVFPK